MAGHGHLGERARGSEHCQTAVLELRQLVPLRLLGGLRNETRVGDESEWHESSDNWRKYKNITTSCTSTGCWDVLASERVIFSNRRPGSRKKKNSLTNLPYPSPRSKTLQFKTSRRHPRLSKKTCIDQSPLSPMPFQSPPARNTFARNKLRIVFSP